MLKNPKQELLPSFRFASYYGDHMVLQQAPKKSTVWGYTNTTDMGKIVDIVLTSEDGSHKSTYKTTVVKGIHRYIVKGIDADRLE